MDIHNHHRRGHDAVVYRRVKRKTGFETLGSPKFILPAPSSSRDDSSNDDDAFFSDEPVYPDDEDYSSSSSSRRTSRQTSSRRNRATAAPSSRVRAKPSTLVYDTSPSKCRGWMDMNAG